jgi:hypothetical protein
MFTVFNVPHYTSLQHSKGIAQLLPDYIMLYNRSKRYQTISNNPKKFKTTGYYGNLSIGDERNAVGWRGI